LQIVFNNFLFGTQIGLFRVVSSAEPRMWEYFVLYFNLTLFIVLL